MALPGPEPRDLEEALDLKGVAARPTLGHKEWVRFRSFAAGLENGHRQPNGGSIGVGVLFRHGHIATLKAGSLWGHEAKEGELEHAVRRFKGAGMRARTLLPLGAGLALLALGSVAPEDFMAHFTVFVLACFVGYMVIWNVTAALHTPLMSVTNAISSIIVIGALLQISSDIPLIKWIAVFTVGITAINIFGGFAVTRRMLERFRK